MFGFDWSPDGYVYDGEESWRIAGPVSDYEQFILVSTEYRGYRGGDSSSKELIALSS